MTPSTIPNRDSTPQNHPNPKDAVSNLDGAAISMGGISLLAFMGGLLGLDSFGLSVPRASKPVPNNDIEHSSNITHLILVVIIVIILSWKSAIPAGFTDYINYI